MSFIEVHDSVTEIFTTSTAFCVAVSTVYEFPPPFGLPTMFWPLRAMERFEVLAQRSLNHRVCCTPEQARAETKYESTKKVNLR